MADDTDGEKGEEEPEEAAEGEAEEAEEEEVDAPAGGKGGKGKLIAAAAVLLLVLGGGGGAYFLGLFDSLLGKEEKKDIAVLELAKPVLYEFPLLKADLKTGRCKLPLLKTLMVVQLGSDDLKRLQSLELRIMDQVTQYLRDQERQDLVGKKGADKLRFEITQIINALMSPSQIHTIMFKEFILQ